MSVPIILSVLLNLQATLQGISAASGYFNTIKASSVVLDPVELQTVPSSEVPYIVLASEVAGQNQYTTSKPTAIRNEFTVPLHARIDVPGSPDGLKLRTAAWQFYADVETALAKDPFRSATVMFTYVEWPTFHFGLANQNQVYIEIPVRFLLQRTYGKP